MALWISALALRTLFRDLAAVKAILDPASRGDYATSTTGGKPNAAWHPGLGIARASETEERERGAVLAGMRRRER